jgi:hypothetical protein
MDSPLQRASFLAKQIKGLASTLAELMEGEHGHVESLARSIKDAAKELEQILNDGDPTTIWT